MNKKKVKIALLVAAALGLAYYFFVYREGKTIKQALGL